MGSVHWLLPTAHTKSSIRAKTAENLDKLNLLDRLFHLRAKAGLSVLTVLTYHRIADSSAIGELDPDVREVDFRGFSEQMAAVRAVGTFVSLEDVHGFFRGKPKPNNPILLTFDDGYAECRTTVLPLLQQWGIPAVFFIPTAFPDSGRLFWWDRIGLLLRRCRKQELVLHYPQTMHFDLRAGTEELRRSLLRIVKHHPLLDLDRFFDELALATNVNLDSAEERNIARNTMLSFQDVRALQDAGMAVASHSHAHRVLATLSPDDVLFDLRKSRMILQDVLGHDVRVLGYPVGHPVTGSVRKAAVLAGFDLGFTNATGLCKTGSADVMNIPRVAIGQDEPAEIYKWRMLVG